MSAARVERVHAEAERNQLSARTKELSAALEALKTDRGVEEAIRERYPLVKPGEVEFVMVDGPVESAASTPKSTTGLWEKVSSFFGL